MNRETLEQELINRKITGSLNGIYDWGFNVIVEYGYQTVIAFYDWKYQQMLEIDIEDDNFKYSITSPQFIFVEQKGWDRPEPLKWFYNLKNGAPIHVEDVKFIGEGKGPESMRFIRICILHNGTTVVYNMDTMSIYEGTEDEIDISSYNEITDNKRASVILNILNHWLIVKRYFKYRKH